MKGDKFICAVCRGVFRESITEEEKLEQLGKEFPGFAPADCSTACNNCFNKMFKPLPQ